MRSRATRAAPDRKYFVGMPIPAAAGLLAATRPFLLRHILSRTGGSPFPGSSWSGSTGFLMVSTWRFWSAKEINFSRRHPFQLLVLLALIAYIVLRYSNVVMFLAALAYMFSGIWARAAMAGQAPTAQKAARSAPARFGPMSSRGRYRSQLADR